MRSLLSAAVAALSAHFFPVWTPHFNGENLILMMCAMFIGITVLNKLMDL